MGNYRLPGATVYVTIEPCAMCAGAMIQARIARLVYGAEDPKGGAVRSCFSMFDHPQLNHRAEVVPGVLAEESAQLCAIFLQREDNSKPAQALALLQRNRHTPANRTPLPLDSSHYRQNDQNEQQQSQARRSDSSPTQCCKAMSAASPGAKAPEESVEPFGSWVFTSRRQPTVSPIGSIRAWQYFRADVGARLRVW